MRIEITALEVWGPTGPLFFVLSFCIAGYILVVVYFDSMVYHAFLSDYEDLKFFKFIFFEIFVI